MKVLVTGAAGFVGTRLTAAARAAGHSVTELVRQAASPSSGANGGTTSETCDLIDREAVAALLKRVRPQVVIHAAARIPSTGREDAFHFFDANVRATLNLLEGAREAAVEHVVYSSSMSVYGPPAYLPVDEKHLTAPTSTYGLSKLEGELYARIYAQSGGPRTTVLRYSGVFGQGQKAGAIPTFITRCLRNEPITLHSGGRPSSDYIWVEDVARANVLALERTSGPEFEIFNIGSGVETSVSQLAELIRTLADSRSEIQRNEEASLRDFRFAYDVGRAVAELRYTPTPMATALGECVRQKRTGEW